MVRNTHNRLLDHDSTDLDTNVVLDGALSAPASTADGATVHQALEDLNTAISSSPGGASDLLTGNDSDFGASVGNWTASGGTLTRDTGVKMAGFSASLKHVTTSTDQYIEVPVSGTFEAGRQYWAVLFIKPPSTITPGPTITLGLIGTDIGAQQIIVGSDDFQMIATPWIPTADRTGVKLRLLMPPTATTYYIGWAKAFLSITTPVLTNQGGGTQARSYIPLGNNSVAVIGAHTGLSGGGLSFGYAGNSRLQSSTEVSGIDAPDSGPAFIWAEHTPGDLAGAGVEIEVGDDYVGLYISEKDSSTIQIYDDGAGSYNIELVDQGSFGFKTVNTTYSTPLSNLHYIKAGTADPSAGGGVTAPIGATYHRDNSGAGELWLKTGASATAWTMLNVP